MKKVPDIMQRQKADLESFMRSHFRRFERKRPTETCKAVSKRGCTK